MKQQMMVKKLTALGMAAALCCSLPACGTQSSGSETQSEAGAGSAGAADEASTGESDADTVSLAEIEEDKQFTDRDLAGTWEAALAVNITLSQSGITADGSQVTVDGNTATITTEGTYRIAGEASDVQIIVEVDKEAKVQLVLDGVTIKNTDTAAIFVRSADKVFVTLAEGSENALEVTGAFAASEEANIDGVIFAKDDLVINGSGSLTVSSLDHGIVGKDDLKITGGDITVSASGKGIEANDSVRIAAGTIRIDSGDDGIHADSSDEEAGYVYIAGGDLTIAAGDDGIHADGQVQIVGGTIDISRSYEGIEGTTITVDDGEVNIISSDDGFNAAGGADGSGFGGMDGQMGRGWMAGGTGSDSYSLTINGGTVYVNAGGDGLDSNGNLFVNGGTIVVDGPTDSANGAIDIGDGCSGIITGGTLIAVGSSGMAENFGSDSTQCSFMTNLSGNATGELVIADADGNTLYSYTPAKSYTNVVFSSPDLSVGETYTIHAGNTSVTVEQTDTITGSGMGMGGFGGGMGQGGFGGGMGQSGFGGGMGQGGHNGGMGGQDPQMGDGEMPQMPDGEMPQMPGGEMPQMPDGEMPQMPDGEMPQMPDGEMPQMGDGEMPQMPGGQMPPGGRGGFQEEEPEDEDSSIASDSDML